MSCPIIVLTQMGYLFWIASGAAMTNNNLPIVRDVKPEDAAEIGVTIQNSISDTGTDRLTPLHVHDQIRQTLRVECTADGGGSRSATSSLGKEKRVLLPLYNAQQTNGPLKVATAALHRLGVPAVEPPPLIGDVSGSPSIVKGPVGRGPLLENPRQQHESCAGRP